MPTNEDQVVTMSLYTFENQKYWAFKQMQLGLAHFKACNGLKFAKILGTGAANGFSIWPDFGRYATLCVWENEAYAQAYFASNDYQKEYSAKADTTTTYWMRPIFGHGQWDGLEPFHYQPHADVAEGKTAVITRATIRVKRLLEFWRHVPSVSKGMGGQDGLQLAVGVGELPLVQQATFSIWDSWAQMKAFAYQGDKHKQVIKMTRERDWYKEELFARFSIYRTL